ncbi:MAG: HAMP domain-containing histidine kinase [Prevotellaceae bacterium]|jgi:signal transduction histidine kinase|nr:HAMP domain-containing histidine kinase [Prevotellaceae bacterium]
MNKRIKLSVCAAVAGVIILMVVQYLWIDWMFRAEQTQVELKSSSLLKDVLSLDIKRSDMERLDILKREGVDVKSEGWGGSIEDKTVTVTVVYPEPKKIVRECKTDEEWHEYTKDVYCQYHYTGISLPRLDSAYRAALTAQGITQSYVLAKIDGENNVMEQTLPEMNYSRYSLSTDTIPLGLEDREFLVARLDGSYYGMFRQIRDRMIVSFAVVVLLVLILRFVVGTIFYQKKLSEMKEDMVNSIIHDLKNPVDYLGNVMSRVKTDETQWEYMDAVKRKVKRLSLMIEKLQAASSMDKALNIHLQPESVCKCVRDTVDRHNADVNDYKIRFISENSFDTANIDSYHFGNAVMNLIDNAAKYSGEKPDICVRCYDGNGRICVSVKDCGVGIPGEYMRYLFEKDFRVPERKSLRRYGLGFGLYYVKIVAKAHGGDVKAKSEYGKGSEFILMLPAIKQKSTI